ncbi:flavin reductase family protein [Candidatus Micrarchaeota archaeon]|nr:flavin reductase family protein [Candidatus Micrarchaeota archaeon]
MKKFYEWLYPKKIVLVTSADRTGRPNIVTLAWAMPVSMEPKMIAVSISPKRYSHELISDTHEFVVNIPGEELEQQMLKCGSVSGRKVDKFEETKLTQEPAKQVKAPLIKECLASFECKMTNAIQTGDHILFVGEVVEVHERREGKGLFDGENDKIIKI